MSDLTKDKRIEEEENRLSLFYADVDETQKAIVTPLIKNAAFMKITLEDLQKQINEEGAVDEYQNGEGQFGRKQSAALQSYNSLIKTYNQTTKLLFSQLPYVRTETPSEWLERLRKREEDDLRRRYENKYGALDDDNYDSDIDEKEMLIKTVTFS